MDSATYKRRTEMLLRWSPVFLSVACALFVVSVQYGSFSARYSLASVILGFAFGLAVVVCWRLETRSRLNTFMVVLVVITWRGADWLLQRWLFNDGKVPGWSDFQGFAANCVAFFVLLSVFRRQIHRFVFHDAEQIVGREAR